MKTMRQTCSISRSPSYRLQKAGSLISSFFRKEGNQNYLELELEQLKSKLNDVKGVFGSYIDLIASSLHEALAEISK